MHPQFLDLLCCPYTQAPLSLEAGYQTQANGMVVSGALVTAEGHRYPIVRGIPRFIDAEHYASSFGYEWNRWPRVQFEAENVGKPMAGHTTRMWEQITGVSDQQVQGQTILDAGCGPGRFLDVVRRKGGRAIGIDLSQAVEAARQNFADDPDVLIVQGDLLNPPFRPGSVDGAYSIGVLHHTPSPSDGLQALAAIVRSGGWVACCVYPRGEFYDYPAVERFRSLHQRLKPRFGYGPALVYAHLSAYGLSPILLKAKRIPGLKQFITHLEKNWLVLLALPDPRWSVLDIFDAITPEIASTHWNEEVYNWLFDSGCTEIQATPWCATSFCGIKT